MPPTPLVKAFLIADAVLQDRVTGKWSVIGVFDRIFAPTFPCVHPTLAIYVKLTDAQGRYRFRIEFRDAEDRVVSGFEGMELDVKDQLQSVDFGVSTHGLPLEKQGRYQFQLHGNGEFLASVPLDAVQVEAPHPPPRT